MKYCMSGIKLNLRVYLYANTMSIGKYWYMCIDGLIFLIFFFRPMRSFDAPTPRLRITIQHLSSSS